MTNRDHGEHVYTSDPYNAGTPPEQQIASFLTPQRHFFVRSHAPAPAINTDTYRLTVDGLVHTPLSLSLDELRSRFVARHVVAALQCAGNRRDQLQATAPIPDEVPWQDDAISTARWEGVALGDLLAAAGVQPGAAHVAFLGLDDDDKAAGGVGGSVPLSKALAEETLLAYSLNGEPLSPDHGFPLRAIVPGYIGARSIKWLGSISVQADPSANYYQQRGYRLFPPGVADTSEPERGLMLGELSVNAAICAPRAGTTCPAGDVTVRGYACAGGGRAICRVDVSADGGETWTCADLGEDGGPWAWRLWEATLPLAAGRYELVARAFDSAANTQPERSALLWNLRGYMNNAWPRVQIDVAD